MVFHRHIELKPVRLDEPCRNLKNAINRDVIPGPRMFVSTRAFAPTGMYPLLGYSWELKMPEGVQIVDGADNIRKAVRE